MEVPSAGVPSLPRVGGLLDVVVVFASAWFDRPMTGRGVDMRWPDVGFYLDGSLSAGVLVCSPGFQPLLRVRDATAQPEAPTERHDEAGEHFTRQP
jgi:hypothetical protein